MRIFSKIITNLKSNTRYLSLAFLTLLILPFQNCGQLESKSTNSTNSQSETSNSQGFIEAQKVLTENCLGCHSANSATGSVAHSSELGFVDSGWVTPQSPGASKLITRLKNYPIDDGSQTMPSGPATLSQAEYQTLYDWVENMSANVADLNCSSSESVHQAALKRLTKNQLTNSLSNAFGNIFAASDFPDLRDDNPRIGFADNPNLLEINEINLNSIYESADLLAAKVIANTTSVQNCITASNTTCFTPLINQFGQSLWRRPLTTPEHTALTSGITNIAQSGLSRAAQMRFLLKAMIMSPNHLFRTETGSTASNGIFNLTHYEVASFLSFSAWDSPPDAILLGLAAQNRLHDLSVLRAQVNRLATDQRYNQKLSQFIIDLLKIEDVRTIEKDSSFNLTTAERSALYNSAAMSIEYSYDSSSASLLAPFGIEQFHLNSQTNRFINGGSGVELRPISLNTSQRYGILSHPAFLTSMSGQISSGIVRRGVFTLEQLFCDHLPPAPADVTPDPNLPVGFDPATASARDILTVTHSSQAACIGCHVKIDPAGFAFESFDNLGRFRTFERGNIPIDASGVLRGIDPDPISFSNSVGFLNELEESPRFKACMNEKFFEYITGFSESNSAQNCEKENFQRNLSEKTENKRSLLESLVELTSFTRRRPAAN